MDTEIKDILVKLLEGQEELKGKVTGLETEVRKNSIKLETIEKKIDIIAEVQTSHKEQNTMESKETNKLLTEKTDIIGTALTSTSKDVKEVKESIDVLKEMTGKHEVDINILKRRVV